MAISLKKGQKISLKKETGSKLTHFCVGCNWGAIEKMVEEKKLFGLFSSTQKKVFSVDLDLSCIMVDAQGEWCDHIYSPEYRQDLLDQIHFPYGKLDSMDGALHHSGDDREGDTDGDDGLDNEIITVNLDKVDSNVHQIFFFLNNVGPEDFSQIPYASIRMYEGTPSKVNEVFAQYNVAAEPAFNGKTALIMGKLYRYEGEWKFGAIGDAHDDKLFAQTIVRILENYAK